MGTTTASAGDPNAASGKMHSAPTMAEQLMEAMQTDVVSGSIPPKATTPGPEQRMPALSALSSQSVATGAFSTGTSDMSLSIASSSANVRASRALSVGSATHNNLFHSTGLPSFLPPPSPAAATVGVGGPGVPGVGVGVGAGASILSAGQTMGASYPTIRTAEELTLSNAGVITYSNGITHTAFHPREHIVAIGSARRNTVGIYDVSALQQKSIGGGGGGRDQRDGREERGAGGRGDRKRTEMKLQSHIRTFQIPPPSPPNLQVEKVVTHLNNFCPAGYHRHSQTPQYLPIGRPHLSSLDFINEGVNTRMIISLNDSTVNVLSFPETETESRLIASFFAFPRYLFQLRVTGEDMRSSLTPVQTVVGSHPTSSSSVLSSSSCSSTHTEPIFKLNWSQTTGLMAVAGEPLSFRIWDVEQELCILDQPTQFDQPVSALSMDPTGYIVVLASGKRLHMFDRREKTNPCFNICLDDNPLCLSPNVLRLNSNIFSVAFSMSSRQDLVIASNNTEITLMDVRQPHRSVTSVSLAQRLGAYYATTTSLVAGFDDQTTAFAPHPTQPYVFISTKKTLFSYQKVGTELRPAAKGLHHITDREYPIQTMTWHPTETALIVSYGTKHAKVFM